MKITTTDLGCVRCLFCKKEVPAASSITGAVPQPGSVMVCFRCGEIMMLGDDMKFRPMAANERKYVSTSILLMASKLKRKRRLQ